jgi:hypothetical protein
MLSAHFILKSQITNLKSSVPPWFVIHRRVARRLNIGPPIRGRYRAINDRAPVICNRSWRLTVDRYELTLKRRYISTVFPASIRLLALRDRVVQNRPGKAGYTIISKDTLTAIDLLPARIRLVKGTRISQRAGPQPKETAEDTDIRVIGVACGLLWCPQIARKTPLNAYSSQGYPLHLRSSTVPQETHAWERLVPGSPCPQRPGRNRDNRDRIQF